ncbi:MAG: IS21 family transposase [Patescibacteria group bacterium]
MYQQITIKTLHKQGKKKTQIAKELNCHRNTVSNIINRELVNQQTRNKLSYFDNFHNQVKELLDQKVTRIRIYEILTEESGLDRTYDSLCKYIQKQFPKKKEAYGVQITNPGEEAEVDFGYVGMQPTNDGRKAKTWVLVITPSYSRNSYYQLTYDQKINSLIQGLINAFEFFHGVPERLKVDNMRTAILKNQHYDLQFNPDLLDFALYHQTIIKPCTPYSPHQKGKVESDVGYVKGNFFCGREFKSRSEMENQLKDWMINYANKRVHGTTKQIPVKVFTQKEQSALQALPKNPFTVFSRVERTVKKNSHINFDSNYYSVPSSLVSKVVTVRHNTKLLRVVYQSQQVALHQLLKTQGEYSTVRAHLPEYKCYSQTEYQKKNELKMNGIGENAREYFKTILLKQKSYWFRSVRLILGLAKEHGNKIVDQSLKRALIYSVTDITTIKNIINKKLYLLDPEPQLPKQLLSISTTKNPKDLTDEIKINEMTSEQIMNHLTRDLEYYQQILLR